MPPHSPPRPTGLSPVSLDVLVRQTGARLDRPGDSATWRVAGAGDPGTGIHAAGAGSPVMVSGVSLRADAARPGDLFAALPGSSAHGASFAAAAARAGAVAILTDLEGLAAIRQQPAAADLPVLVTARPRTVVGGLAATVYHNPSRHIDVLGVTGTSGKTTTCYFIEAALAATGRRAGLIGTVTVRIDGHALPSMLTTPEAPDLQALLAVMRQRGVQAVAAEVSSHALVQGRVSGTAFAVGAFTNLSQDHLDFHGDMESYFAAKRMLFDGRAAREVVVIDDEYGRRLAADRPQAVTVSAAGANADWTGWARPAAGGAQDVQISGPGGLRLATRIPLPGAFNVANALTALACVAAAADRDSTAGGGPAAGAERLAGIDLQAAADGLAATVVPGRMERVDAGQPFLAVVDYAHKPAAIAAVLDAIRPGLAGRVVVVVGAGGDRDHAKRPMMGAAAAGRAEVVIVTDDNPRSEPPAAIRAQVLTGARSVTGGAQVVEIGDRRAAIAAAVENARPGDAVLILGKGHELGQEIAGVVHPFSDRDELAAALAGWRDGPGMTP